MAAAVCNAWFLSFGVRTAGDWGYFVKAASDTLRRHYFAVWLSDTQFGRVLIDAGQAPTYAAYGWLSYYLHTGYALNERIVHLWPAAIVAVVGSYMLVRYIFKDRLAAALGALIYAGNTYYLALLTGGLTLAVAYALAPLAVLFYMKAINRRSGVDVLVCALLLAVCGAYEPRIAYIVSVALGILAAVHFFFVWQPTHRLFSWATARVLLVYGGPFMLFGLLNAYWILGLMHAGGASNAAISSSLFGNEFFTLSEALTLFHPYWTGGQIQPFFIHPVPLYFWLVPLAAVAGLAVSKRTPVVLFFAFIGVLGVLLTKQSDEPFAGLYHWLFAHVPGFNAFREASKFYLLTALAYAVLLPALYWFVKTRYRKPWLSWLCLAGLSLLFLPNVIPVATNKIGGTFRPRSMPAQYVQLNKFLDSPGYGRVLWVPQKSRWSYFSANHPAVSAAELVRTSWKGLAESYTAANNATPTDEITALLQTSYMPAMLSSAGIKYVVVPMRDVGNDDNFYRNYNDDPAMFADTLASVSYLKESSTHIDGFKIYETKQAPRPYFSSTDKLYGVANDAQLPAAYDFWNHSVATDSGFNFALGSTGRDYTTGITDLFGGLDAAGLAHGTLPVAKRSPGKQADYYFDQRYGEVSYTATANALSLLHTPLPSPGAPAAGKSTTTTWPLGVGTDYVISTGSMVSPLLRNQGSPTYLGSPRDDIRLYAVSSGNLVPKPTIYGSLWQKKPEDCAPYGSSANIRMVSSQDNEVNKPVMSLMADDHAACSGPPPIPVQAGEPYLLHMAYRGFDTQFAGYRLQYDVPGGKAITTDIPLSDNDWHTYETIITAPRGARHITIKFVGRPSNQIKDNTLTSYSGLWLAQLKDVTTFRTATGDIEQAAAPATATRYQGYAYDNLIPNGSFNTGLWRKQVGDCDAYDNNAALGMSLVPHDTKDAHALQLGAKRHIACTNTDKLKVQGGATYLLQFDYQSPNGDNAGYVVTVDDRAATKFSRLIPITDRAWHTYRQTITLPPDARALSLAVFAYSSADQATYVLNHYDNFVLQRVPDVQNRFYAVSKPGEDLSEPKKISYRTVSSTYKKVTVSGADKPFVLLMGEQYHPAWHVVLGDAAEGRSTNYLPWKPQPELAAADHIQANGYENAWYIDPAAICKTDPAACTRNADGTYDLRFGVQFSAQRWFNFGMLISGTTAVVCVGALGFLLLRQWRKRQGERKVYYHGKTK
ncbi:MAG TPA: hypothetical protein VLF40_05040 [Candidatus Saccharimonadales bacterium]|nr:hypothetical protein [Candidatus Saccharimonadales bacterium]